jgi:hypothetical protein
MDSVFEEMVAYLKLAQAYRSRSLLPDRDRALLLAAVNASLLQMHPLAELCRKMILQNNHGHMLRKFESVAEAIHDSDFQAFAKQIRRKIPFEKAQLIMADLDYTVSIRKSDYGTESEYAAALLGVDVAWIKAHFGDE